MTTQRKNFDRAYKLHAACAISEVQPEMAYITFRKGYAYASDGHMAARAKVETIATGFQQAADIHIVIYDQIMEWR